MPEDKLQNIMLLSQLINALSESFKVMQKAYEDNDKEKFDSSKKIVLEAQRRINFLLNKQ